MRGRRLLPLWSVRRPLRREAAPLRPSLHAHCRRCQVGLRGCGGLEPQNWLPSLARRPDQRATRRQAGAAGARASRRRCPSAAPGGAGRQSGRTARRRARRCTRARRARRAPRRRAAEPPPRPPRRARPPSAAPSGRCGQACARQAGGEARSRRTARSCARVLRARRACGGHACWRGGRPCCEVRGRIHCPLHAAALLCTRPWGRPDMPMRGAPTAASSVPPGPAEASPCRMRRPRCCSGAGGGGARGAPVRVNAQREQRLDDVHAVVQRGPLQRREARAVARLGQPRLLRQQRAQAGQVAVRGRLPDGVHDRRARRRCAAPCARGHAQARGSAAQLRSGAAGAPRHTGQRRARRGSQRGRGCTRGRSLTPRWRSARQAQPCSAASAGRPGCRNERPARAVGANPTASAPAGAAAWCSAALASAEVSHVWGVPALARANVPSRRRAGRGARTCFLERRAAQAAGRAIAAVRQLRASVGQQRLYFALHRRRSCPPGGGGARAPAPRSALPASRVPWPRRLRRPARPAARSTAALRAPAAYLRLPTEALL